MKVTGRLSGKMRATNKRMTDSKVLSLVKTMNGVSRKQ